MLTDISDKGGHRTIGTTRKFEEVPQVGYATRLFWHNGSEQPLLGGRLAYGHLHRVLRDHIAENRNGAL